MTRRRSIFDGVSELKVYFVEADTKSKSAIVMLFPPPDRGMRSWLARGRCPVHNDARV